LFCVSYQNFFPVMSTVPAIPAVTDATAASVAELHEAVVHFLAPEEHPPASLGYTRASGGVNNKCTYVATKDGQEYVLRIYNNGGNSKRVDYEHAVLRMLADKHFSFEVPLPLPVRSDPKATSVVLSTGASACMFKRIRGAAADSSNDVARAIGAATAELVQGMQGMSVDLPLPNPLYRNMYDAHHFITRDTFMELVKGPRCDHVRDAANKLLAELELIERLIERILAMNPPLPQQQIHADLHVANVLVHDGKVSAVLDFEFAAPDWRIMELVVGLTKYIATPGAEEAFAAYVDGYKQVGGKLTPEEAQFVPELIILRVLNNVIYFAGRALAGEDDLAALTTRMDMYAARCAWIRERAAWMTQVLNEKLVTKQ